MPLAVILFALGYSSFTIGTINGTPEVHPSMSVVEKCPRNAQANYHGQLIKGETRTKTTSAMKAWKKDSPSLNEAQISKGPLMRG